MVNEVIVYGQKQKKDILHRDGQKERQPGLAGEEIRPRSGVGSQGFEVKRCPRHAIARWEVACTPVTLSAVGFKIFRKLSRRKSSGGRAKTYSETFQNLELPGVHKVLDP